MNWPDRAKRSERCWTVRQSRPEHLLAKRLFGRQVEEGGVHVLQEEATASVSLATQEGKA